MRSPFSPLLRVCVVIVACGFPTAAAAFRVGMVPSDATVTVDDSITMTLTVDTEGEVVNLADITLAFPPDVFRSVVQMDGGSAFPIPLLPPVLDPSAGILRIVAATPSPGVIGEHAKIADVLFVPRHAGEMGVEVLPVSTVYLNDGFGTPRPLRVPVAARITVVGTPPPPVATRPVLQSPAGAPSPPLREEPIPLAVPTMPSAPAAFSPTHPDPVRWYAHPDAVVLWTLEPGLRYRYTITRSRDDIPPAMMAEYNRGRVEFRGLSDGVSYVHIRAGSNEVWGPATIVRLAVDTRPPEPFTVNVLVPDPAFDHQYALAFVTTDATSSVAGYVVEEPGHSVTVSSSPYVLVRQAPGTFPVRVTALDQAGNWRQTEIVVAIPGAALPWRRVAIALGMIVYAVVLVMLLVFHRRVPRSVRAGDARG